MTRSRSRFRRLESFRSLGARAEEELLHLTFKKLSRLGLNGRQAVLVDQHCLMLQPARPSLLRDILEYALAELAGIRLTIEARRFGFQNYTLNITGHSGYSENSNRVGLESVSSSVLIGAGSPIRAGSRALYQ